MKPILGFFGFKGLTSLGPGLSVLQLLSTSPSNTVSSTTTRFGLSDCKGKIPRRWSRRPGRHPEDPDQVCWTDTASSGRIWRKSRGLPLQCLHWTLFASRSQGGKNSATLGFIALPHERGCLAPDVLGVPNSDVQQALIQNAKCNHEDPNQVTSSIAALHHIMEHMLPLLSVKVFIYFDLI